MKAIARDTHPEAERVLLEGYRTMTPDQKLRAIAELQRAADQLAIAGIRRRHPTASPIEEQLRLAALKYPRTLMIAAFDWDPAARGY